MSANLEAGRMGVLASESRKLGAFLRRDVLIAWSYRLSFISDWINMLVQVVVFYFVGKLVDPAIVEKLGYGKDVSYLEFAAIGIALSSFMAIALGRVNTVIRQEQVQGTLESLLLTPTAFTTIQMGSVVYDIVYVPIRTLIFLGLTALVFAASYDWSGLGPALGILLVYIPFVWGIGILAAAWTLTFKRGTGIVGLLTTAITLMSGAYFPVDQLPTWLQPYAEILPMTIALEGIRDVMLKDAGWARVLPVIKVVAPCAVVSLALGTIAFRAAFNRERRRGTLGLY
jgi:ABC-2 type transport system permease protein